MTPEIGLHCVYCICVFYVSEDDVEVTGDATIAVIKKTVECADCNRVFHPGRMLPIFKGEAEDEPQTDSVGS